MFFIWVFFLAFTSSFANDADWNPYPFGEYPCTLNLYRAPAVTAGRMNGCYDDQNVCIEMHFRYVMDYLNNWAMDCGVEVIVCRSFVHTKLNEVGSIMTKNNEVGHGVDVWLKDNSDGSVHSGQLENNMNNPSVKCFMDKLSVEPTLRWKISEPSTQHQSKGAAIHVDDNRYKANHQYWVYLKNRLYNYCKFS